MRAFLSLAFAAILLSFAAGHPAAAANWFIAPSGATPAGNNSNNGTAAATPKLTVNAVITAGAVCGDTIWAAPASGYASSSLAISTTVTSCPAANGSRALLISCGTGAAAWVYSGCFVATTSDTSPIAVTNSNIAIYGFVASSTGGDTSANGCISANPATSGTTTHDIYFVGDIVNVCNGDGFSTLPYGGNTGPASVDYAFMWYDVAYGAAQKGCFAGFSFYEPANYDYIPGQHLWLGFNIGYDASEGGTPVCTTDSEGIKFDTLDGSQSSLTPFSSQSAAIGNLLFGNAGNGIAIGLNNDPVYSGRITVAWNTLYGNSTYSGMGTPGYVSDLEIARVKFADIHHNIIQTTQPAAHFYAMGIYNADPTSTIDYNFADAVSSSYQLDNDTPYLGFVFGNNNIYQQPPAFASTADPGAPSCSGKASMPACYAATLAGFVPTNSAAKGVGALPFAATAATALARGSNLIPKQICTLVSQLPAWTLQGLCQ